MARSYDDPAYDPTARRLEHARASVDTDENEARGGRRTSESLEQRDAGASGARVRRRGAGSLGSSRRARAVPPGPRSRATRTAGHTSTVRFVAWGAVAGRPEELAQALGGEALCLFPPGEPRPRVLVRWLRSAVATVPYVLSERPGVLVVTNPPAVAALVGWFSARLVGARLVLDSHPGAFGAQGDRVAAVLQPLHRWATRRATLSLVASERWRARVEQWGGQAVVVHEAPGAWQARPPARVAASRVLYVGRFARDEPWREVIEAARITPQLEVHMTGTPPADLDPAVLPPNVRLVGYLGPDEYRQAVYDADVVMSLTTEPGSVMRAGCEAVWAGRPLVVTGWPSSRQAFPFAVYVDNDPESIAEALRHAVRTFRLLTDRAVDAVAVQRRRWEDQRDELARRLCLDVSVEGSPSSGRGEG